MRDETPTPDKFGVLLSQREMLDAVGMPTTRFNGLRARGLVGFVTSSGFVTRTLFEDERGAYSEARGAYRRYHFAHAVLLALFDAFTGSENYPELTNGFTSPSMSAALGSYIVGNQAGAVWSYLDQFSLSDLVDPELLDGFTDIDGERAPLMIAGATYRFKQSYAGTNGGLVDYCLAHSSGTPAAIQRWFLSGADYRHGETAVALFQANVNAAIVRVARHLLRRPKAPAARLTDGSGAVFVADPENPDAYRRLVTRPAEIRPVARLGTTHAATSASGDDQ